MPYLQKLKSLLFCESMTFVNAAKHLVEIWVVYQHVIYFALCDRSFYAAAHCVNPILQYKHSSLVLHMQAACGLQKQAPHT